MPTTRANKKNKAAKKLRPNRFQAAKKLRPNRFQAAKNRIRILVQYAVPRRGVPSAARLRRWALMAASSPVTLRIVGERESRWLNRGFRKKNYATNVLTFATGDVVLCHPVIRREARAQGKSLGAHYAHLVVHGCLHLRGYDHEKKRDAARMEAREIRILRRVGVHNPYAPSVE